ncbi:flagellar assembly protein FliW [Halobacillus litoralis]|uniref:flagellar assembly protein FliW n=1 Tax=Halobacillus litoralis TaxID=45668 RepID=UPI001CD6A2D4|nr:flagellar assembly protein FliW [Halobacillus litoralis]MCA0971570.1 flagellar assembly protein FliW [Halobacillus litoralis]
MKVQTKYFGEVEVDEKDQIAFEQGLPGFRDYQTFVMLTIPEAPFYVVLQSLEVHDLAFILTNPYIFFQDYEFDIDGTSEEELEINSTKEVEVYSVITIRDPFKQSTINLQAPIIYNKNTNQAKQIVLNSSVYHTKHLIIQEEEGGSNARP